MIFLSQQAEAQKVKGKEKHNTVRRNTTAKKQVQRQDTLAGKTVLLNSTTNNAAYGGTTAQRFSIADPTINALNRQAAGNAPVVSESGVVGMPRRTYGFANGKILLRPTTAPTSGTVYGSGSVGTGTTIMGVGTGENALGVNGKNPYAGPWLWGSRPPVRSQPLTDSARRR